MTCRQQHQGADGYLGGEVGGESPSHRSLGRMTRIVPDPVHGFCDDRDGDVEEEQAKGDDEPEEEGNYPAQFLSMEDETCGPPAVTSVSVS